MRRYFLGRLVELVPIFFLISFLAFWLLSIMPGDPLLSMRMENPRVFASDPARLAELRAAYHLDDPLPVKYANWLGGLFKGDLGYSLLYKKPVTELMGVYIPNTLVLTVTAWLLGLLIALPIGVYSAVRKYSVFDYAMTVAAFMGISLPSFWFALMAIIVFGVGLQWLPVSGMFSFDAKPGWPAFVDCLRHLVLPALTLGIVQVASWVRYVRTSFLETLDQDYIRTAYAKGVPNRLVILKHAFRNALIPIITIVTLDIPYFFGGAVIIETVFSWPGMGGLMYRAVAGKDYNLAINCLMFLTAVTLLSNLLADVLYAAVDPRIRLAKGRRKNT